MKRCPRCNTEYPDDANWCRLDGGRLQKVAEPPKAAPQPGALTMGWDAQPDASAAQTNPSMLAHGGPQMPQKPGALTMGWDAVQDPQTPPATTPSQLAAKAAGAQMPQQPGALTMGWDAQPEPQPSGPRAPQQPGALTMGWDAQPEPSQPASGPRVPQQPGALTMGWDAQPEPSGPQLPQKPGALTMGWDAQPEPAQPQPVSPSQLAANAKDHSAKSTLLGMMPIRDDVGVPQFSSTHRVAQPIPVARPIETPPSQPAQPEPPPSVVVEQHAIAVREPTPPPARRPATTTDSLDKPPRNMLPIYAAIGLVVVAGVIVAIFLLTQ